MAAGASLATPPDHDQVTVAPYGALTLATQRPSTAFHTPLTVTLTVSAARRRWGGRRVPFAPDEPPGGLSLLPFAQRAICVRGSPGGPGGVPRVPLRQLPDLVA